MDHTTAVTALDPTCSQPSDSASPANQTQSPETTSVPADNAQTPDEDIDEFEHPQWARGQDCPACGSDEIGGVDIQSNAYIATSRSLTRSKDGQVLAELVNWCRDCNELLYKHPLAEKLGLSPTSEDATESAAAESAQGTDSTRDRQPAADKESTGEQSQAHLEAQDPAAKQAADDQECWPPSDPYLEEQNSSDRADDRRTTDDVEPVDEASEEEIPETLPDDWM